MAKRKRRRRKPKKLTRPILQTKDAEILTERINAFLQKGEYEQAWATCQQLESLNANKVAQGARAEIRFRQAMTAQDAQVRLQYLQRAVQYAPDDGLYWYHLGLAQYEAGNPEKAISAYRKAHQMGVDAARLAYPWALALLETGKDELPLPLKGSEKRALQVVRALQNGREVNLAFNGNAEGVDAIWQGLLQLDHQRTEVAQTALERARREELAPLVDAVRRYYLGVLAARRREYDVALQLWREAKEQGLSSLWLRDNLASAYRIQSTQLLLEKKWAEAVESAQAGLEVKPNDRVLADNAAYAHFHLGLEAAEAEEWEQAVQHWTAAQEVAPSRQLAANLALALEQQERWEEAADAWRDMIRRRPRRKDNPNYLDDAQVAAIWAHIAECYLKGGDPEEAVQTCKRALKYAPNDIDLHLKLADAQLANDNSYAALNTLTVAQRLDPENLVVLRRLAAIEQQLGYTWLAVEHWKEALTQDPTDVDAQQGLTLYYEQRLRQLWGFATLDHIRAFVEEGLQLLPRSGILHVAMGRLEALEGNVKAAVQYFEEAIQAEPNNGSLYLEIVHFWLQHEEPERAAKVLEQAEARLHSPRVFINLGLAYAIADEPEQAFDLFDKAQQEASNDPTVVVTVVEALRDHERLDIAESYVRHVLARNPENGYAYYVQGLIHVTQARTHEARRSWRRARSLARRTGDERLMEMLEEAEMLLSPSRVMRALLEMFGGIDDEEFDFFEE